MIYKGSIDYRCAYAQFLVVNSQGFWLFLAFGRTYTFRKDPTHCFMNGTPGDLSFWQMFLKKEEIVNILGTIFSSRSMHIPSEYFRQQDGVCEIKPK